MDIYPYSYQQEILDKLEAERTVRGYTRNLVMAATGTGKTVISALDYKRFRKQNPDKPCRLLFVAHREEILKQSLYTFRAVLKDANFGEMFVGRLSIKCNTLKKDLSGRFPAKTSSGAVIEKVNDLIEFFIRKRPKIKTFRKKETKQSIHIFI